MISTSWAGLNLAASRAGKSRTRCRLFAEEVMPVIARECGGKVELPERGYNFTA